MLAIESLRSDLAALPGLARLGLVVMVASGLADVIAHLEVGGVAEAVGHAHQHTPLEAWAHLGGFVSMVLILAGVVIDGVRRSRARRHSVGLQRKGVA